MMQPLAGSAQRAAGAGPPRTLSILGVTGSIGKSTRSIIAQNPGRFAVDAVVGGSDVDALAVCARELGAKFAAIADESAYGRLKTALSGSGIEVGAGREAVNEAAMRPVDLVVAAITGIAGLEPTLRAALAGQRIALANKETLVSGGAMFMAAAARAGATILPLDSEHNALFQALGDNPLSSVEKMILTASGGPFREWSLEQLAGATRAQALAHPNYAMGQKVTIDSATLMNKGLELIEAHFIFGIEPDRLGMLVHPQQLVHGLVSFSDGSVNAGMAVPDMRVPVAHCLGWPERLTTEIRRLDLASIGKLTFEDADRTRFPALALAEAALAEGGAMPTILNAADEIAVEAFLAGRIDFFGIARLVETTLNTVSRTIGRDAPMTLDDVQSVNRVSMAMAVEGLSSAMPHAIR